MRARRLLTAGGVGAAVISIVAGNPAWAAKPPSNSGSCRKCATTDTTPPAVAITSPGAGTTVSGSVAIAGTASDNISVAYVDVAIDGGSWQRAAGTSSWGVNVDTSAMSNGSHTAVARATDAAGNASSTSETVSVSNPATDTTAPTVSIASPAPATTVAGTITVAGSAGDNVGVASVLVSVDGGSAIDASGTTSWSVALDTSTYPSGSHTIVAIAKDAAGNAGSASVGVTFSNPTPSATGGSDVVLSDPNATNSLQLLGRGRAAEWGSVSATLYWEEYTTRRAVFFRDASSGTSTYVSLPVDNNNGWSTAAYTMTSASDLWIFGGGGPVNVRHYTLAGGPVPTSATLVSDDIFGDTDTRMGDLVKLASGGLIAVWHQQGASGPQGMWVGYRAPAATGWQVTGPLQFMPTKASKQTVVQHPVDGSVWVFSDPDAWGAIGAIHLTEVGSGVTIDWTDANYINVTKYADEGPDPENPDLESAPDPSTGTIALAYQSAHRQMFQTSPTVVTGSWPVVARIDTAGVPSFLQLPSYVERISSLGLVVRPGETWLAYRPIDTATMTFDQLYTSVYRNGSWQAASHLGQLYTSYERVDSGMSRPEFLTRLADDRVHLFLPS
ncbi:MAG TPA: Ig-like domain-containing protein [Acidimicrobiales bacterium]|nr:Ig-like domain-containing protein [Acidimicrobiales bacterium]